MIRTVLTDIPVTGFCHAQCHEHIWLEKGASFQANPALCMDDPDRSLEELCIYREAGGDLIVDAQPLGCGRNAGMLAWLSQHSGVCIVAVTGFHKKVFFDTTVLLRLSEERLASLYESEVKEGMFESDGGQSKYKAGLVKVAFEPKGLDDPVYGVMFSAAAAAAAAAHTPVMVHTEKNADILRLITWFSERGIPPDRLIICHLDRTHCDASYHKEVLSTGCFLCYDSVHRLKYISDEDEIRLIQMIAEEGYSEQILLSLDTTRQRLQAYDGRGFGLDYILRSYIPMLRGQGISEEEIDGMCRRNAQRALQITNKNDVEPGRT